MNITEGKLNSLVRMETGLKMRQKRNEKTVCGEEKWAYREGAIVLAHGERRWSE